MAGKIEGRVVSVTDAGDLLTDIRAEQLVGAPRDERVRIACDEHVTLGLFGPEHTEPEMTFLAVIGKDGLLRLEIVGDNASLMLGVRVGERVVVEWE
jgi:S-adenosylmethionine hydrolase